MDNLEEAVKKRDKAQKNLEDTITKLVKEQYRLAGKIVYEPVDLELDKLVNNGLDSQFEWN